MIKNKLIYLTIIVLLIWSFAFNNISKAEQISEDEIIKVAATNTTNTTENPENTNVNLKELSIEGYDMYPEFNKNTNTYYVSIPKDVKSLEVNATTEVESSSVKISGNTSMWKTENTITVTVTSKNRNTKRYTIIATKQDDNGLKLSSLEVEGATLEPEFSENRYTYKLSMEIIKEDTIPPLNIIAKSNDENAEIEILGNSNLTEGDNLITIFVRSGDDVSIYQINANISSKTMVTTVQESENQLYEIVNLCKNKIMEWFEDENRKLATIIAGGVVIVVLIIIIVVKGHNKRKVEKKAANIKKRAK